jgi:hypothetical protein
MLEIRGGEPLMLSLSKHGVGLVSNLLGETCFPVAKTVRRAAA